MLAILLGSIFMIISVVENNSAVWKEFNVAAWDKGEVEWGLGRGSN